LWRAGAETAATCRNVVPMDVFYEQPPLQSSRDHRVKGRRLQGSASNTPRRVHVICSRPDSLNSRRAKPVVPTQSLSAYRSPTYSESIESENKMLYALDQKIDGHCLNDNLKTGRFTQEGSLRLKLLYLGLRHFLWWYIVFSRLMYTLLPAEEDSTDNGRKF